MGVLAAPCRPAARPLSLPARRRRPLDRRAARAVVFRHEEAGGQLNRRWLEQVESRAGGDEARAVLAWLAGTHVAIGEEELQAAVRRAMLLLAAGGDPHRALALDGRAVTGLAADLDRQERREALARGLEDLRAEAAGLPGAAAALDALLGDADLAWRSYAAGLLGEELAEDQD